MIDAEVKIFNRVHERVAPLCVKNRFLSVPIQDYLKLPAASLYEMDNATIQRAQSSTPTENRARITYQAEAVASTKAECRKVMDTLDTSMLAMNFSRMSGQIMISMDNDKLFRMVARYEAEIDTEGNLYRMA